MAILSMPAADFVHRQMLRNEALSEVETSGNAILLRRGGLLTLLTPPREIL